MCRGWPVISISAEVIGAGLLALLSGVFWYWVKSISKQRDVDRADVEYIKREYVRRDDHRIETSRVYDLLKEIKSQLQKVDDKLDKKADK